MIEGPKVWFSRLVSYITNHIVCHLPSFSFRRSWYRLAGLPIGAGSGIHQGCFLWFHGPRSLARNGSRVGANSRINRDCCLDLRGQLVIGDNVSISPEVAILTAQHRWREPGFVLESHPVVIEDHAWIGFRAILLPGTHVGRGAVVAAGAVASGEVPPLSVVAGVPARVIATRPEEALDYLLGDPFPLYE